MTAYHVVKTFTYPLEKEDIVKKSQELARRNGLSFSAYLIKLLTEEVEKNREAQRNPLNLYPKSFTDMDRNSNDIIQVGIFTSSYDFKRKVQEVLDSENNVYKIATAKDNFMICYKLSDTKNRELIGLKEKRKYQSHKYDRQRQVTLNG